jgi:hypothetical protein
MLAAAPGLYSNMKKTEFMFALDVTRQHDWYLSVRKYVGCRVMYVMSVRASESALRNCLYAHMSDHYHCVISYMGWRGEQAGRL